MQKQLEKAKVLTDYREESTFSFDPGKLPLVLLEKGHQQNQARNAKARKKMMQASRNQAQPVVELPEQPHVADLVWALAKSEAVKLEAVRAELEGRPDFSFTRDRQRTEPLPTITVPSPPLTVLPVDETHAKLVPRARPTTSRQPEEDDHVELTYNLHISEPKPPVDNKDCDSGMVNFASSFNTDVGYSSETSRAPSYPSSVVFKRRNYTNKSVSQNYSSLTESIESQPDGELPVRFSPSPITPIDSDELLVTKLRNRTRNRLTTGNGGDSRRLSYKRACDPDKRISMACDSALSADSDLSCASQRRREEQTSEPDALPIEDGVNHLHCLASEARLEAVERQQQQQQQQPPFDSKTLDEQRYVTEGTETDSTWLARRQSYQKSHSGARTAGNHLGKARRNQASYHSRAMARRHRRLCSVHCCITVYRFVRSCLQRVVQSPWMDFFITISIILNTAFLAAEHHGMSPDVKQVLDVGNKVIETRLN